MKKVIIIILILVVIGGIGKLAYDKLVSKKPAGAPATIKPTEAEAPAYEWPPKDLSSVGLTTKAWEYLNVENYEGALAYADECIKLYEEQALDQQSQLTDFAVKQLVNDYWALNDVGTCYFIKGEVYRKQGKNDEAKVAYQTVIDKFGYAQCWDLRGWHWKVAEGAKDKMLAMQGIIIPEQSFEFASKAWGALGAGDYNAVELYTTKCIERFEDKALEQQRSLSDFPDSKADEDNNGTLDVHENYWALNDIATCHFILGKALAEQGKQEEANKHFEKIINELFYAQCWDPQGWFWKVRDGAKTELERPMLPDKYDIGNDTSETLTVKAWNALGTKNLEAVEFYTSRCIKKYSDEAQKFQSELTEYAPKERAFDYWALNDVGTCYFIRGEAYMNGKMWDKAEKDFQIILDNYSYAQCWDPKGWFWKPAVGARGRLNKIKVEKEMAAKEKAGENQKEEVKTQ